MIKVAVKRTGQCLTEDRGCPNGIVAEGATAELLTEIDVGRPRQGRGYVKVMATKYRTSKRTVRSWVDRASKSEC